MFTSRADRSSLPTVHDVGLSGQMNQYDLCDLYDLYDIDEWEPYSLHDLLLLRGTIVNRTKYCS